MWLMDAPCGAEFAIVDEAYPYVAKMLLTDDSPRLRASLKYMVSYLLLVSFKLPVELLIVFLQHF